MMNNEESLMKKVLTRDEFDKNDRQKKINNCNH